MPSDYQRIVAEWPDASKQACERVVDKYGPPDEAAESRLIWHDNGPWKRTELLRDPVKHHWPMEHNDMVESIVSYRVPPQMCSKLAEFDGSVMVERTKGELSARCEAEEANMLALNLAHEVITEKRTVEEARAEYARNMQQKQTGEMGPYMKELLFQPMKDAADPDVATLDTDGNRIRSEEDALAARL